MKKRNVLALLTLTLAMTSMTGCGNKETAVPAATETVIETETEEAAELTVTTTGTDFVFETGKPIMVFDLLSDVSSTSEITVAYSDETALLGAQAEEEVTDTESTELIEDTESTEDAETTESTEGIESTEDIGDTESTGDTENTEATEETLSFDSYGFALTDMPVLCYMASGEYTNTITVTNAEGETFTQEFHFTIADAPVITAEDGEITVGDEDGLAAFTCSASATDAADGDLTASVTADASAVQLDTAGTYPVTFTVKNNSGIEASKTVEVTVKAETAKNTDKGTASKTNTSKKNDSNSNKSQTNSSTAGNSSNAAASGSNTAGSNGGNSQTSNNNATDNNGNTGSADTSGNSGNNGNAAVPSTPSTDNNASTPSAPAQEAPSTPTPAPETPSTDTGSSSGGGMTVPDSGFGAGAENELPDSMLDNTGTGGQAGTDITEIDPYN